MQKKIIVRLSRKERSIPGEIVPRSSYGRPRIFETPLTSGGGRPPAG